MVDKPFAVEGADGLSSGVFASSGPHLGDRYTLLHAVDVADDQVTTLVDLSHDQVSLVGRIGVHHLLCPSFG